MSPHRAAPALLLLAAPLDSSANGRASDVGSPLPDCKNPATGAKPRGAVRYRWLSLLAAVLAQWSTGRAQDAPPTEMVEFQVRFVEATAKQIFDILNIGDRNESLAAPLAPPSAPPESAPAILNVVSVLPAEQTTDLIKKLKEQQINITATPRATTLIGRKALVENIKEFRYPSVFSKPDKNGKIFPEEFETRPIGIRMELAPTNESANTIDVTLFTVISELTGFAGEKSHPSKAAIPPKPDPAWQPLFKTNQVATEVTISSGGTIVLCTSGNGEGGREIFIFITARKVSSP